MWGDTSLWFWFVFPLKLQYFGHLMWRVDSLEDSDAGRDWGQEEKGTTEDEMAGWHHWLDGHKSEWTPGVGDGQGGLACCNSWGRKESDTTERLNWTELMSSLEKYIFNSSACFFDWVVFQHKTAWAVCAFWTWIPCWLFPLQIFLPFFGLPFHFVYGFLCCGETIKFNYVQFVYFCFYFLTLGGGS